MSQLGDRTFRRVMWQSLSVTVAIFTGFAALFSWGLESIWGWLGLPFAGFAVSLGGLAIFLLSMWALGPALVTGVISMFLGKIISAVEQKYYPSDTPGNDLPVFRETFVAIRFLVTLLLLNVAILPLLLFPPIYFIFYWIMNGYLVSREYFELVGHRYTDIATIRKARHHHRAKLFLFGVFTAIILTIPLINFLAPLIATAAMVHLYKRL